MAELADFLEEERVTLDDMEALGEAFVCELLCGCQCFGLLDKLYQQSVLIDVEVPEEWSKVVWKVPTFVNPELGVEVVKE